MNNSKELLQSPLFQSVAGLAFESVMVTILKLRQNSGSRNSGCFAQNEEEH